MVNKKIKEENMVWKCPGCGKLINDTEKKCACGYSFYEILGVQPDASVEKIEQTYKYLLKVWGSPESFKEPTLRKKAEERLKNIKDAYALFRHFNPIIEATPKRRDIVRIASLSTIGILLLVVILVFIFTSKEEKIKEPSISQPQEKAEVQTSTENQIGTKNLPAGSISSLKEETRTETQQSPSEAKISTIDIQAEKTEEWAIESVKKAYLPRSLSDVETMVNKWTADNAGKYKVIGWQAKKMDEQTYLVSYTVSDGLSIKGFYFDINTETGVIRSLDEHPDLQKKYGIQYGQQ